MGKLFKMWLMGASLVLVATGVVTLRRELGREAPPAMSVPAGRDARPDEPRVTHQPTILQAKPLERRSDSSPPYREQSPAASAEFVQPLPLPAESFESSPGVHSGTLPETGAGAYLAPTADGDAEPGLPPRALQPLIPSTGGVLAVAGEQVSAWPEEQPALKQLVAEEPHLEPLPAADVKPAIYTTQADDSLWMISERHYGTGEFYKALFVHNRARVGQPDRIPAGVILQIPPLSQLVAEYPEYCPPSSLAAPAVSGRLSEPAGMLR